jgi:hypothetical protein
MRKGKKVEAAPALEPAGREPISTAELGRKRGGLLQLIFRLSCPGTAIQYAIRAFRGTNSPRGLIAEAA